MSHSSMAAGDKARFNNLISSQSDSSIRADCKPHCELSCQSGIERSYLAIAYTQRFERMYRPRIRWQTGKFVLFL